MLRRRLLEAMSRHRLALAVAGAVAVQCGLCRVGGFGAALDAALLYNPAQKARAALGRQPALDPRIRLVVADDSSLDSLGRRPRFDEWAAIAAQLGKLGYRKMVYYGLPALDPALSDPAAPVPGLVLGVVVFPSAQGSRALPTEALPRALLAPAAGAPSRWAKAPAVLGTKAELLPVATSLGAMNIASDNSFPLAFTTDRSDLILPNIALTAADGLRYDGGAFAAAGGSLPASADGLLHADFVASASVVASSTRVNAFFQKVAGGQAIAPEMSARVADRLRGGEVALLIPDGHTGSRLLESPVEGKVPSYMAGVSLVHGVLTQHLLYRPVNEHLAALILALAVVLAALIPRLKLAVAACSALVAVSFFGGGAGFLAFGWMLPGAQGALAGLVALTVRATHRVFATAVAKASLDAELALGRRVQTLCFPAERSGRIGSWSYRLYYQPYGAMSGDWLQLSALDGGFVAGIGDVVGKGASAALLTAVVATVWRGVVARRLPDGAEGLVGAIDEAIEAAFGDGLNSTLSLASVEGASLRVACLGAPRWLCVTPGAGVAPVRTPAVNPLGLNARTAKRMFLEIKPEPGQVFVAMTDGILDGSVAFQAFAAKGALFNAEAPTEELFQLIVDAALATGKGHVMADDRTLLFLRFEPG